MPIQLCHLFIRNVLLDVHTEQLPTFLDAHPFMQKDQCLEEVVDACTDFLWGEAVQQQLQGLHTLRYQVDATILHRAG